MNHESVVRRVPIGPINLLTRGKDLIGDQYWLFVGITLLGVLIGSALPLGILMGPMMCGIYLCYLTRSRGERATIDLLFKGFDYFLDSFLAMLIMVGVMLVFMVPLYILAFVLFFSTIAANQGEPPAPVIIGLAVVLYLVMLIVMIAVSMPFLFVFQLIVDRGLKPVDAVKTSCRGVLRNFVGLLMTIFVFSVISMIGACMCYVPAILFMPLSFGGIFVAYRDIFPDEAQAKPLA